MADQQPDNYRGVQLAGQLRDRFGRQVLTSQAAAELENQHLEIERLRAELSRLQTAGGQGVEPTGREVLRNVFALCEATEDAPEREAKNEHQQGFERGRRFEAKQIRRAIGEWFQDQKPAHPPAAPALVPLTHTEDLDAWKCERCNGDGWHWQTVQVAERKSDQQEVRTHCDECEGLGWLGPDSERAAEPVTQQEQGDRMVFEKQASDSFNFKRSRRGTYVNPPIARDWKWFKAGAAHARARPLVLLSESAVNLLIASSEVYEYHPGAMLEFAKDLTRQFCRINGLTVGGDGGA